MIAASLTTAAVAQASTSVQCSVFYTVQRGDTLSRIARAQDVTAANLRAWNSISNPNRSYAGQQLCVGQQTIIDDNDDNGSTYTVQAGDTLSRIARRPGVSMSVLAQVNGITDPNRIYVGQVLVIPDVTIQG